MALGVSDLAKSRAFYQDFLGFTEPAAVAPGKSASTAVFIKVNDDQFIELLPGLPPGEDRLRHIAFSTENAEQMRRYLKAHNVSVPARVSKTQTGDVSFQVADPEGHAVEFTEYKAAGWTRRGQGQFLGQERISARILHLGIIVGAVPAAFGFYRETLGFTEFWRGNARGTDTVSWINVRLPESPDYIEFMLYSTKPAPDARLSQHHICLEVPDIQQALATLEARPGRKSYTRPLEIRTGVNQRRQLNLYDPDGTRIELMEPRTVDGKPAPASTSPLPVVR